MPLLPKPIRALLRGKPARPQAITLRAALGASKLEVDAENGLVKGVPIITAGTIRPPSMGSQFDVDAVLLQQVVDLINAAEHGVPSRLSHPSEGEDYIAELVGMFSNARLDGDRVLADFKAGSYAANSPHGDLRAFILGLAAEAPHACGVSLDGSGVYEIANTPTGRVFRCEQLSAIDWVGKPAANPTGLLSAGDSTEGTETMSQKQMDFLRAQGLPFDATDEQIAAFIAALGDDQKAQFAALKDDPAVEAAVDAANAAGGEAPKEDKPAAMAASVQASAKPEPASATLSVSAKAHDEATAAGVQLGVETERARVKVIKETVQLAGLSDEFARTHIDKGTSADDIRRLALEERKKAMPPIQMGSHPSVTVGDDRAAIALRDAIRDAVSLRSGIPLYDAVEETGVLGGRLQLNTDGTAKTRKPHEMANQFRHRTMLDIGREFLIRLGANKAAELSRMQLSGILLSRQKFRHFLERNGVNIQLAHATGDFPELLADSLGKSLRAAYILKQPTWAAWCRKATAPDFKAIKRLQLSAAADLASIVEGGEYTYGTLTESKETYTLGKYGKGIKFTREALINDDLSAFDRMPAALMSAARRLEEVTAYSILTTNAALADGSNLFSTAHANLTTGALTVASLSAARAAMRKQTALGSSDPLDIMPKFLIVPEAISVTAEQLIGSTVDPAKSNATPNPFANKLTVISQPRLDSNSTTIWYLAADPSEIDTVEMAFLEGEEGPTIEQEEEFDDDTLKIKVRHHVAAKAIDYRGLVRSSGA